MLRDVSDLVKKKTINKSLGKRALKGRDRERERKV